MQFSDIHHNPDQLIYNPYSHATSCDPWDCDPLIARKRHIIKVVNGCISRWYSCWLRNRFHRFHRFYCFLHVDSHSIQNINPSAYTLIRARTLTIPLQCMGCTHLGHRTCCAVNFPPSLPVAKQLPKSVVFKPVLESKHRQFRKYTST